MAFGVATCFWVALWLRAAGAAAAATGFADPFLRAACQAPLFEVPATQVNASLRRLRGSLGALVATYHKSGIVFGRNLVSVFHHPFQDVLFHDYGHQSRPSAGGFWRARVRPDFRVSHVHLVEAPSTDWPLPTRVRLLHMYRDPVSLVVSAYRYHLRLGELVRESDEYRRGEYWILQPATCAWCDSATHTALFAPCGFRCTLLERLRGASSEAEGLALEALHMRAPLAQMVGNLRRWANHPAVLHLSVEHLRADFNGSMACFLDFLGLAGGSAGGGGGGFGPAPPAVLLEALQFARPRADNSGERHVAPGRGLPESSEEEVLGSLRRQLAGRPAWAPQLAAARGLASQVFRRQGREYGCPDAAP